MFLFSADLRPFTQKLLASGLFVWLGSASLAGVLLGLSDLVRIAVAGNGWVGVSIAAAVVGLWVLPAQVLAIGAWLAFGVGAKIRRHIAHQSTWHWALAGLAGALAWPVAHKIFSGAGIQLTRVGAWGPYVLPLCVFLAARLCLSIIAWFRASRSAQRARLVSAVGLALLTVCMLVLENRAFGGYLYFNMLLLMSALASAILSLSMLATPTLLRAPAIALSLASVPPLLVFPSSLPARKLLARETWAGLRIVEYCQFKVDFDHDGYSPLFGGGDCDDSDPRVFATAPEFAGDGRDSDCDGFDNPTPNVLAFEPFRRDANGRAKSIAEQAKHYPTVVILVDALRYDRVENPRFPILSQLAQESIRFAHVYSTSSSTLTSIPAIVSGRVQPAHGRDTIAQSLARSGQQSAFVSVDLINARLHLGVFDSLQGFSSHEGIETDYTRGWGTGGTVATTEAITARAVKLLDSEQPPDLLWLHYFDVHQWDKLEQEGLPPHGDVARYDAVVARFEAGLRPLFERRNRINLVLLADHGEALGAHYITHHGDWVFQEATHIPLVVHVPGIEPSVVEVPVSTTGIFNLLRDLRGLERDPTVGDSLLDLIGAVDVGNGPGFASFESRQWSLLYGSYRLVYTPREELAELYDVVADPTEKNDVATQEQHLTSQLLARLFRLHNEPRQ